MADDKVTIYFENDLLTDGRGDTARLNGSVTVDYTTNTFSGSYQVKNSFMDSSGDYFGTLTQRNGRYSFTTSERFSLSYVGQTPSAVRASYVANTSDTYDAANNPAGERAQPVRSDVVSSSDPSVCFTSGTLIRTTRGDVLVERLAVGDVAVTASGSHRPVRWIGSRTIDCRKHPRPHEVMPVAISANALGDARPARTLRVSPGHSLCIDVVGEVLIPAASLVNGTTIRVESVDQVTYWHVELDGGHDVILAENLPCESYLEMTNRGFFRDSETVDLFAAPDAPPATHDDFCRPFHAAGPIVDFVRERLAARAPVIGWLLQTNELADLHLLVDGQRIAPETRDLSARFLLPADAKDVWLVSETSVPAEVGLAPDLRALGVCVGQIVVDDGIGTARTIAADDARLRDGFHDSECGPQRWTNGRAKLVPALWEGCRGRFFLRVDLTRPAVPRWVAVEQELQGDEPCALAS